MKYSPPVLAIALLTRLGGAPSLDAQTAPPKLKVSLSPSTITAGTKVRTTFELVNVGPDEAELTNRNTTIEIMPPDQVEMFCNEGEVEPTSWELSALGGACILTPKSKLDFEQGAKLSLQVPLRGLAPGRFAFEVPALLDTQQAAGSPYPLPIEVTKLSPKVAFSADRYLVASGSATVLSWKVTCPTGAGCEQSLRIGNEEWQPVAAEASRRLAPLATTTYTLRAEGAEVEAASKSLTVRVPKDGFGWLQLPAPEGAPVPTILMSDIRNSRLYAVFVRLEDGQPKQPTLFRLDPDLRWTAIQTTSKPCAGGVKPGLPPGMETSSGVYYDGDRSGQGALYLLAGSVAFNGRVGNDIWRLPVPQAGDPGIWTQLLCGQEERPAPRSGQTAVVHQEAIWMLGGYDSLSRSLQEVWTFSDGWKRLEPAGFPARGLLTAISLKKSSELWVLGGFDGYQQKPLIDFWILDSSGWKPIPRFSAPFERPAALALGTTDGNPPAFLSVSYQKTPGNFDNSSWILTASGQTSVQHGGTFDFNFAGESSVSTYFSLQTVPFGGAMCGRALGATNTWPQRLQGHGVLFCFVPQSGQAR